MNIGGGEAADQLVRMLLSGTEVSVRLGGSALKNLLALTMALAKNNKTISGKVNLGRMLRETRDLRQFPMTPEQYKQFAKLAKKQKILFSAIHDRDDRGKLIDVILPVTELDRANMIFERLAYAPQELRSERSAPQRAREAPGEPQQERSRVQGREEQNQPQRPQNGPSQEEQSPPTGREEVAPPKKDSRSGRDSPDINTSSATLSDSERMRRMVEGPTDRPSVEERLKGFRAQLDQRRQSAPTRSKTRTKTQTRQR